MKKSKFIQILEQHQSEEIKVLGFLLFKGQDSEAIRQLKSILRHPQVFSLPDEAQLPSEAIAAVKKTMLDATNVDSRTKQVLESLRQLLPQAHNTRSTSSASAAGSSNSNVMTVVRVATSTKRPDFFKLGPGFFSGMSTLVAENIFSWLDDKSLRAYFRVFVINKDAEHNGVREGALNSIQERFSQFVADAEMKSAEAILKLAMLKKSMLMKLLTTNKTIIQKNGIPVTGTALEIALKCWDWSSCEGSPDEMTEMLMRYMRMLQVGEELIRGVMQKLFPNGFQAHHEGQEERAKEFSQVILEPLVEVLKNASDSDRALVYALTKIKDDAVDAYISNTLANNQLWQTLIKHHEAVKDFMQIDVIYNPNYLQKAFEVANKKFSDDWHMRKDDRPSLFFIHGVGGIQACSSTIVWMLYATGSLFDFYYRKELDESSLKVERDCTFKASGTNVFALSGSGMSLVGKKFWMSGDRREIDVDWGQCQGHLIWLRKFCPAKTKNLEKGVYMGQNSSKLKPMESSTTVPTQSFENKLAFFEGLPYQLVELIINSISDNNSRFMFFLVLCGTKNEAYQRARLGAVTAIQEHFSKYVINAEMKKAAGILRRVQFNPPMLRELLTTNKKLIQMNGLSIEGCVLELAFKCWDYSSVVGGRDEMAEMLMRYLYMVLPGKGLISDKEIPKGQLLIENTIQNLFPRGSEIHHKEQQTQAEAFAKSILDPLAQTLKKASDDDIRLVYAITQEKDEHVDAYIANSLSENPLWKALREHHEAIKTRMEEDKIYNPCLIQKALKIFKAQYEEERWDYWYDSLRWCRFILLCIHGIGGIQACSPALVQMLFVWNGIWDFYNLQNDTQRKQFEVKREFRSSNMFSRSAGGELLLAKKYFVDGMPSMTGSDGSRLISAEAAGEDFLSSKSNALENRPK